MLITALYCFLPTAPILFAASIKDSAVDKEKNQPRLQESQFQSGDTVKDQNSKIGKGTKIKAVALDSTQLLDAYRKNLQLLREEYGGSRDLPDVRFFLFG